MSEEEFHYPGSKLRIGLIILLLGLLAVGTIIIMSFLEKPHYYRDPARTGDSTDYDKFMNPTLVNLPDYEGVLESINVQTNETGLIIEMPKFNGQEEYINNPSLEFVIQDHGEAFESGSGNIWLEYFAIAYGTIPPEKIERREPEELPAMYFDTSFQELSAEATSELEPGRFERNLYFNGVFPALAIGLKEDMADEVIVLGYDIFDSHAHRSLKSSGLSGPPMRFEDKFKAPMTVSLWHSTPLEFVVDIAVGPPMVFEFPAEVGERIAFPEGELMLTTKAESLYRSRSSFNKDRVELQIRPMRLRPIPGFDQTTTSLIFAVVPIADQASLSIELLNDQGEIIREMTSNTTDIFTEKIVFSEAAKIKTVRLKYYPDKKRLIFRIPAIPGLPEENQNVENLFDVRVPYVRINQIYDYRELVNELTQLNVTGARPTNNAFAGPMVFGDITVKELVDEYAKLFGPTYGAKIDQENLTIEFLDMSMKARALRLWETVKSRFQ